MTETFLARRADPEETDLVAIYRLLPHARARGSAFARALRPLLSFCHPNLAALFEVEESSSEVYAIAEYVSGEAVSALRVGRVQLSPRLACHIVAEAAAGLQDLHDCGLVHDDLRPSHLVVSYDGEVKWVEVGHALADLEHRFARPGTRRFRLAYLAPEIFEGAARGPKTEVFGLGTLLYELLTSTSLFVGESPQESRDSVRRALVERPSHANPEIPPRLDAVVRAALARSPEARIESAAALAQALRELQPGLGGGVDARELGSFMRSSFPSLLRERRDLEEAALSETAGFEILEESSLSEDDADDPSLTPAFHLDNDPAREPSSVRVAVLGGLFISLLLVSTWALVQILLREA